MARLHQLVYLVPVVAGVALGPTAATAVASTATVVETLHPPECKYVPPGRECLPLPLRVLVFEGGPGEANEVDQIEGGLGRNTIFAGSGKDSVNPQYRGSDFGAERIFCGPGADRVSWLFPTDFVNDDCESLGFDFLADGGLIGGDVTSHLPLRAGGGRLVITAPELYCLPIVDPGCRLELALLVHGRHGSRGTAPPRGTVLGTASHTFAPDERKPASLALSADGAAILRRHGSLRVRVRVTEPGADQPAGYLTVLRAPRREGHGA